jgi:hypothetical protein
MSHCPNVDDLFLSLERNNGNKEVVMRDLLFNIGYASNELVFGIRLLVEIS